MLGGCGRIANRTADRTAKSIHSFVYLYIYYLTPYLLFAKPSGDYVLKIEDPKIYRRALPYILLKFNYIHFNRLYFANRYARIVKSMELA